MEDNRNIKNGEGVSITIVFLMKILKSNFNMIKHSTIYIKGILLYPVLDCSN